LQCFNPIPKKNPDGPLEGSRRAVVSALAPLTRLMNVSLLGGSLVSKRVPCHHVMLYGALVGAL
jgi:hypothetical protein